MKEEDALLYIVRWVRSKTPSQYPNYGYDIYLPNVIRSFLSSRNPRISEQEAYQSLRELFPVFVDAAWALCRRGIIRPGVKEHGAQKVKRKRGQIRSWLFTVDSGKGRFRRRESLFGSAANNPERKTRLHREIEATDRQIDQLVYELYGLTEVKSKIVEEST